MEIDIEEVVRAQVAAKVVENLPEAEIKKLLEQSLTKTMGEILKPWIIKETIDPYVRKYMQEYISQPEVQAQIKLNTEKAFDELMGGVIKSIIVASQSDIKSQYRKFIEEKE